MKARLEHSLSVKTHSSLTNPELLKQNSTSNLQRSNRLLIGQSLQTKLALKRNETQLDEIKAKRKRELLGVAEEDDEPEVQFQINKGAKKKGRINKQDILLLNQQ